MAKQLSRPVAIKQWLELGAQPISARELMEFIKSCSGAEKEDYARVSCAELTKALGEEFELAPAA